MLILSNFSQHLINLDKRFVCIIFIVCGQDIEFLSHHLYVQQQFAHLFTHKIATAKYTAFITQTNVTNS